MTTPKNDAAQLLQTLQSTVFERQTARLILDAFEPSDAPRIKMLAGDYDIYRMTAQIPHPYALHHATDWLAGHAPAFKKGNGVTWAIRPGPKAPIVGCIGLELSVEDQVATLGYWIGKPYWRQGFATEAALAVRGWARDAGFVRMAAECFKENTASQKILERLGLRHEGCRIGHIIRDEKRQDLMLFGADLEDMLKGSDKKEEVFE